MKNAYVTALTESILAGKDVEETLSSVKSQMIKRGHSRLWSQVLRASKRVLEAKLKSTVPVVTVAKDGGVDKATIVAALQKIGGAEMSYNQTIDSTLVGGFTVRFKDTLYDASYKKVLVDLYRKIIN